MNANKRNRLKRNLLYNKSQDNSTLNTLNMTQCFNPMNGNDINCPSPIIIHTKKNKGKIINTKNINDIKKINIKSRNNIKKNKINKTNTNNSILIPNNYIKSLNYSFNNQIHVVNTQFDNYKKSHITKKNNTYNNYFNYISNKNKNKNSFKNNTSKNSFYCNNRNEKFGYNKNLKKVFSSVNQSRDFENNINTPIEKENEINHKIIKIQKNYRGYLIRKKICNTFLFYIKFIKMFDILQQKIISYKNDFMKNIILQIKCQDTNIHNQKINNKKIPYDICRTDNIYINQIFNKHNNMPGIKRKNIDYTICTINNININDNNDSNINIHDKCYSIEEKKLYEEKLKEISNENKIIKQKNIEYQKNEDKYIKIKKENEKLNNINNIIIKEKTQLLSELKNIKKENEQLLNLKNNLSDLKPINQIEINININKEKENNDISNNISENINIINLNSNLNIIKPGVDDKKEREKYLRNLFRNKVFEMKEYIHRCFTKFYYNGIFLKMTGKLSHLNEAKNDDNDIKNNNNILSEKEQKEKEQKEKEEKEKNDLKERIKKSRHLRALMIKRANERLETLRIYFYKFYRAGIISKLRKARKRNSLQFRENYNVELTQKLLNDNTIETTKITMKNTFKLASKEIREKEELKKKTVNILEKIIFKADRKNMIIMKKIFQKYYLLTKLESVKNIIKKDKVKNKKKKKINKKNEKNDNDNDNENKKDIQNNDGELNKKENSINNENN